MLEPLSRPHWLRPRAISPAESAWLDALRALAALWVMAAHLRLYEITGASAPDWVPGRGHDAVILFFVLSGFLIAHAGAQRFDQGLRRYTADRAARILSVAVPALLLSIVAAQLGWVSVTFPNEPLYQLDKLWAYVPFHLAFLSQSWGLAETPHGLPAWWSLPFEVWYYISFGVLLFVRGWLRWLLLAICVAVMGPKLWALWPCWLVGVLAYAVAHRPAPRLLGAMLMVTALTCYALVELTDLDRAIRTLALAPLGGWSAQPLGLASDFAADWLTAMLAALLLLGIAWARPVMPKPLAEGFATLASVTFTLYLTHGIVYMALVALGIRALPADMAAILALCAALSGAYALALVTELRRDVWRTMVEWLWDRGEALWRHKTGSTGGASKR
jgi:peptidoglycan/LPS O-acetylase OafA/YrhL